MKKKTEFWKRETKRNLHLDREKNLCTDDDVVDRDVDELDKKSDKAHNSEPDGGGVGDFVEFLTIGFTEKRYFEKFSEIGKNVFSIFQNRPYTFSAA